MLRDSAPLQNRPPLRVGEVAKIGLHGDPGRQTAMQAFIIYMAALGSELIEIKGAQITCATSEQWAVAADSRTEQSPAVPFTRLPLWFYERG